MSCPRDDNVADIMGRTRAQHHYVIRRTKSNNKLLRKSAMARRIVTKNPEICSQRTIKLEANSLQFQKILMIFSE